MKICVIDDERAVRTGVIFKLNSLGKSMDVFDAGYGQVALEQVRVVRPELIIADIMMPGLDGLELLRHVKSELPNASVYLLTGYSEFEYARKAIQLGADGYLLKPAAKEELSKLVETVNRKWQERVAGDLRRLNAELQHQYYLDALTIDRPTEWFDAGIPKHIRLGADAAAIRGGEEDTVAILQIKPGLYGVVKRCNWSETGSYTHAEQFAAVLAKQVAHWESESFFRDTSACRHKNGDDPSQAAALRHRILLEMKALNIERLTLELHAFLDLVGGFELSRLRKACAFLMAALDEHLTIGHDVTIVEEDRLAYWTAWTMGHTSWAVLRRSIDRFVVGGASALADLDANPSPNELVDRAKRALQQAKGSEISLEAVAASLSVHPVTLSRMFKQETGENFVRYVVRYKMNLAARLLKEGDRKAGQIAEEVGYADYRYFSQLFKTMHGTSPAAYRKTHLHREKG
ncbi:response regulator [Paenibacillus sp. IB182496]|uniref:Response regulator n=1 Tax=Paenibacillus sabuli TaxID=2772509 RepID=A0A927BWG5_9BACL|nr:response regulator [Paenibacillus sabuli]MBD2848143.1 response regulator [Paenibacillus sabuli]